MFSRIDIHMAIGASLISVMPVRAVALRLF
jgi:hypothetical protein